MDADDTIRQTLEFNPLRAATMRSMVKALGLPAGSRGLDAGCGIGLQCLLFAEEVGAAGHVTGLDLSAEMLDYGREMVSSAGLAERVSLQQGDIASLPFGDASFDWAWSADCVGYGPWEPMPLLQEMIRVLKPGGTLAIAAWSSEKLLPGHPRLEARLGATTAGIAPFVQGKPPQAHFLSALGWLRELELAEPRTATFAGSAGAPLSDATRNALTALFGMRWPGVAAELSPEDLAEFRRLCQADSADFILNRPDYAAFFTYTMFWGRKTA